MEKTMNHLVLPKLKGYRSPIFVERYRGKQLKKLKPETALNRVKIRVDRDKAAVENYNHILKKEFVEKTSTLQQESLEMCIRFFQATDFYDANNQVAQNSLSNRDRIQAMTTNAKLAQDLQEIPIELATIDQMITTYAEEALEASNATCALISKRLYEFLLPSPATIKNLDMPLLSMNDLMQIDKKANDLRAQILNSYINKGAYYEEA